MLRGLPPRLEKSVTGERTIDGSVSLCWIFSLRAFVCQIKKRKDSIILFDDNGWQDGIPVGYEEEEEEEEEEPLKETEPKGTTENEKKAIL